MGKFTQHGQWSKPYCIMTHILSYFIAYPWFVCDQFAKHISFSFPFFLKGWTRLPCRWHHIRVRWHGSGWILLCECQCTHKFFLCWNYVASLTFFSNIGRSVWTSRFGSIEFSAATAVGLEDNATRCFPPMPTLRYSEEYVKNLIFFYIILKRCLCVRVQINECLRRQGSKIINFSATSAIGIEQDAATWRALIRQHQTDNSFIEENQEKNNKTFSKKKEA